MIRDFLFVLFALIFGAAVGALSVWIEVRFPNSWWARVNSGTSP